MAFTSAEDRVDSDSFKSITAILGGASPWKSFITDALTATLANVPGDVFQVLPPSEYVTALAKIAPKADPEHDPGVTDKPNGQIRMKGYFGTASRESMLGLSLHETVHLISHKPGKGGSHSSAFVFLEEGLLEGLVERVTTDILTAQNIALASSKKRGHQERVPVVDELMSTYGIGVPLLGPVLFKGDFDRVFRLMEATFGQDGWREVKRLTTANNPSKAKTRMAELRAAEEKTNPGGFKAKLKQAGPSTAVLKSVSQVVIR